MTARHAKLLVENTIDSLKVVQGTAPNTRYNVAFSVSMEPGELSDSETLSFLDALQGAVGRFNKDGKMNIVLNVSVVSKIQDEILSRIEEGFSRVVKLETSPPQLELPPGMDRR